MGYTKIAGMPVVTGLYTILIPTALFALFGSSRHLVVGADSATAAIMAAGLAGLAATASPEYVAYAGILALLAAFFLILARLIKLGFLADFLSRTVLIGFLTGVGIQVAIGQISGMLGIPGGGSGPIQKLTNDFEQLSQTNPYTVAVSIAVIVIILGSRMISHKIPGALIAVVGSIVVSQAVDLSAYGVAVLGTVPGGLPKIGLPTGVTLTPQIMGQLLGVAFSMFIVILAQSAATSRAYATRYSETFSENVDLVGLGLANVGAGLSGTFVVNGSPTKTQMVDGAGGRSQLSTLTTSVIVLIVLLFLTKPLSYMPEAVLSSVVFLIGIELVDMKGMRRIFAERRDEFWVAWW
jgi:MFS superfamily sulfate permease-like transporter